MVKMKLIARKWKVCYNILAKAYMMKSCLLCWTCSVNNIHVSAGLCAISSQQELDDLHGVGSTINQNMEAEPGTVQ